MKPLAVLAFLVGLLFVALAVLYWSVPPGSLPSVLPGYQPGVAVGHHVKHAIGALALALALFAFGWFRSGPKRA